ncbi:MAG: TetR/AcrR family transcriptional regulator [Saprospiraceae bacterium]
MSKTAERIFKKSDELFMRYGIRSITMDEIARRLGISKKTLYQYVENKADLIKKVVQQHMQEDMATCLDIQSKAEDAIHEMILSARHATEQLRELSPTIVHDLKKYYPQCWELIEQMHNEGMYEIIKENLERGIQQGVYRSEINTEIIARFHTSQMTLLVDEDIFPLKKYNRQNLMEQFMSYHIHGIASPKGIELYKKHTQQ